MELETEIFLALIWERVPFWSFANIPQAFGGWWMWGCVWWLNACYRHPHTGAWLTEPYSNWCARWFPDYNPHSNIYIYWNVCIQYTLGARLVTVLTLWVVLFRVRAPMMISFLLVVVWATESQLLERCFTGICAYVHQTENRTNIDVTLAE